MPSKWEKEIVKVIEKHCDDYTLEKSGRNGHFCLHIRAHGGERKIYQSSSPSDHRTLKNFEKWIKRALLELELGERIL